MKRIEEQTKTKSDKDIDCKSRKNSFAIAYIHFKDDLVQEADPVMDKLMVIADKLRHSYNLPVIHVHDGKNIGKKLNKADKLRCLGCVIIGESEMEKNVILFKEFEKSKQTEFSADNLDELAYYMTSLVKENQKELMI